MRIQLSLLIATFALITLILPAHARAAAIDMVAQQDTGGQTAVDDNPKPPIVDATSIEELRPGRITILREGSALLRARGQVRSGPRGTWIFVLPTREPQPGPIEMFLLPSLQLAEMERLLRIGDEPIEEALFEVSGEVFVYQGRNYLLPTFAPRLIAPIGRNELLDDHDETRSEPDHADAEPRAPIDDLDSVQQIMQELEAAVGPIARVDGSATVQNGEGMRDGERIVNRRGRLTRDERGAWVFIFDADASGLTDPPLTILPCLMLEEMAAHARSHGNALTMLISGTVTTYGSQLYVLPSMYRIPRNLTPISR